MQNKWFIGAATGVTMAFAMQAANADVAVYGAPGDTAWNADVVSKITTAAAGRLGAVVDHRLCQTSGPCEPTPTLAQLQAYRSVLVYSDNTFDDSTALGNVLADYVDGGGRVVVATFAMNADGLGIAGRFESEGYLPVSLGSQTGIGNGNLVAVDAGNPILEGVTSFNGGSSGYAASVTLNAGAQLVATWDDAAATPLIAVKGNVTALNFYPPSSDARADFWAANTDGGQLMANALYPGVVVTTASLPNGQRGQAYSAPALTANGGVQPYTWSAVGLPTGLHMSAAGVITGTPTQQGSFTVQLTVQDSSIPALSKTVTLPLQIDAAPVPSTPTPVPTLGAVGLVALSSMLAMVGLVRRRKPMA